MFRRNSIYSQCHFYSYSYPSELTIYELITNNFPGGIFQKVRRVSLQDERPFEHEFFFRISQSFPFMERLVVSNKKPQKKQTISKITKSRFIKYPYLIELDLYHAHKDYYKQFLFDDRSCLPKNISVYMDYRFAKKVTQNFTSNAARNNCAKIVFIAFLNKSKFPDHIKDYFLRALDLL